MELIGKDETVIAAGDGSRPARILLVDDDERNLLAMSEVLGDLAEVVTATSGAEALRYLLKNEVAVILLDVFMPVMDGYETASLVREREQTARIPIIFLSAVNKETEHLMRGYGMGAVDYVFKPVDPLILKSKVGVFVDLYEMRVQVEEKSRAEQDLRDANFKAELARLQIERELAASRERETAIIQSLPILLYLEPADASPRCPAFVSGDFAAMTGFEFDEVERNPRMWEERLHPDDRERVLAAMEARWTSGRHSIEYRWQCSDGTFKYFHDQAVLVQDPGNGPAQFAGTLTNVTEQRVLESHLLHAQKMDAIGKLTGGIAHDFNNLLSAVLGGLHLLERRLELGDREQLLITQMRHAAEQGAELVRRMMAFARKQELSPTSVDAKSLCSAVSGLVEHTLAGTVQVEWNCADDIPHIYADRSQLELALVNLIINSRDAMPNGGRVEVSIDIEEVSESAGAGQPTGRYVFIRVRDDGEGIPEGLVDRVTEPFFTTKEAGKGTGLGLSMVAGFVQQSGGLIRIDSKPGQGTTIDLLFPCTDEVEKPASGKPAEPPIRVEQRRSVLLVDDDEMVRTVLGEQLRDMGFRVDEVADGQSAIERLKGDGSYDVLLSDLAMPGMNGIETIRAALRARPSMRTLLMTGYADEDAVGDYRGQFPIIRKPVDINDLVGRIVA